jgi:hypothetical protein
MAADSNNEDYIWSIKNGDLETIAKYIDSVTLVHTVHNNNINF